MDPTSRAAGADVAVTVGEGRRHLALDRATGQFPWATPFYDVKNSLPRSSIDGRPDHHLNTDRIFREPGQRHVLCYWNTRPTGPRYHPVRILHPVRGQLHGHDVRVPAAASAGQARTARRLVFPVRWVVHAAKINMATGEMT
jgi:hypothetical protein